MKKLRSILSKVLGIDESSITDDTSPDSVETWDSFNGLIMVSDLEKNYNVKFTTEEVISVKCVRDIKTSLTRHGVKFDE